ncbi:MAG: ATP-binding cassette domain-containing protein [Clostridia bacterium]|nr:ATP-binding cassette domain-containing protein [Clostridia bacterium]
MKVVLQNITKIFPGRNKKVKDEVIAVNDFNLEIPDGKLVCLLGPSGCGKSTTLYMISGLQAPSSGKIFFGDDDVTNLTPENRGIGLVFQNYALYPHMTVQQNILFPLQNLKGENRLSQEEMLKRVAEAAKLVQIDEYLNRKPSELSGGQQQRVAIARALVKMPRVLLLDEPLSNLDARLRLQTREEIRRIQRSTQITTIFVTHDQEEAMSISDYIVIMKLGVIMQTGKPQWVYDDPANLFVAKFLGAPPINLFSGKVESGKLYIGEEHVLDAKGVEDQEVYVGIRPEGFKLDKAGKLTCKVSGIDVMGRDISVVSTSESSLNPVVRSIVSADEIGNVTGEFAKFNLKEHKVLIFNKETEQRVYFGSQIAAHQEMIAQMEAEGHMFVANEGPLPREADDKVKEHVVAEPKKNVFVKAFNAVKKFCVNLFKKKDGKNEEEVPKVIEAAPAEEKEQAPEVVEVVPVEEKAQEPEVVETAPAEENEQVPEVIEVAPAEEKEQAPKAKTSAPKSKASAIKTSAPKSSASKAKTSASKSSAPKAKTTHTEEKEG